MSLIVAKLLSEHDTQSDSARNNSKHPPKQSITARCSTPPAATTIPTTAAVTAIASAIIHRSLLRPHLTTIARSIPTRSRHANIELLAHLIEKPNKDYTVVSKLFKVETTKKKVSGSNAYPSHPPQDPRKYSRRKP